MVPRHFSVPRIKAFNNLIKCGPFYGAFLCKHYTFSVLLLYIIVIGKYVELDKKSEWGYNNIFQISEKALIEMTQRLAFCCPKEQQINTLER